MNLGTTNACGITARSDGRHSTSLPVDLKMGLGGQQHESSNRNNRYRISQYLVRDGFFPGRRSSRALP
jgi:hypothetical protein